MLLKLRRRSVILLRGVASRRSEVVAMRVFSSTDLDDQEGTEHNHAKEQYGVGKERQ